MFERYTEKARRVVFYARYEASEYGSSHIETEHLLLGLLREDRALSLRFLGSTDVLLEIRAEIEKVITRNQSIPTSVEIPLTAECKKVLNFAGEEGERLGLKHVGTEHLLLALLRVEGSLAARLLLERGLKAEAIREALAKTLGILNPRPDPQSFWTAAKLVVETFLAGLKWHSWDQMVHFFAGKAEVIDYTGKRCVGRDEIGKQVEVLFAPYAKKNVTFLLEATSIGPGGSVSASILWDNVTFGGKPTRTTHRMTVILALEKEDWAVFFVQVTPVLVQSSGESHAASS